MIPHERQRMRFLCERLGKGQDRDKFMVLVRELGDSQSWSSQDRVESLMSCCSEY